MARSFVLAVFVLGQALALFVAGLATFWWSMDLMRWLIWLVGVEYALGKDNVIRTEGGGTLITNPGAMIRWTVPFWLLGLLQITASATLIKLWLATKCTSKDSCPR